MENTTEETANKIKAALEAIKKDESIKPTQHELARIAKVSRGSINNYKWSLEILNDIKKSRQEKLNKAKESTKISVFSDSKTMIRNGQQERLDFFNQVTSLKEEVFRFKRQCESMIKEIERLKKELRDSKVKQIKDKHIDNESNIIHLDT